MSQSDDPGRPDTPYGQGAGSAQPYGAPADPHGTPPGYGQPEYGQPQQGQPQYGQPEYGQPQYGQPEYGQPQYGQPQYGQPQYGQQPSYGQPAYGQQQYPSPAPYGAQYGQYGTSAVPARPPHVIVAAVLGFIFGALGVLASLFFLIGGALASGAAGSADDEFAELGVYAGVLGGAFIIGGLLALAWTVVTIWGSVWALTGRSRVMLLVGGSIALVFTLIGLLGSAGDNSSTGGGIIVNVLFVVGALAIVVLLCLRPAADFFAAHRGRRRA
jgi:hypothetical protein